MKQRDLTANIKCSVVGFGGGSISGSSGGYGFGDITEKDAAKLLEYAYEKGITLFDTAPIYGYGSSERRIGATLAKHPNIRSQITIVSKLGVTWDENYNRRVDNSPEIVKRMLEQSLRDLQTDYLDVYMIHWPDPNTPVEQTMRVLSDYKRAGVIKSIGACNFGTELLSQANEIEPIEVLQSEFNAFNNINAKQLFARCKQDKLGFMAYGTLAKGILSGRVTTNRHYDKSDIRSKMPFVKKQAKTLVKEQQEFINIAKELNVTPATLAAAYVLNHDVVSTALIGAKNLEQIDSMLPANDFAIPPAVMQQLNTLCEQATPIYLAAYN